MKPIHLSALLILASTLLWSNEGGIIITYKTTDQSLIKALENQYELTRIKFIEPINAGLYRSMQDTDWVLSQVSAESIVAYAEKDYPIQLNSTFNGTIDDQWYLENKNTSNIDINWLASQDYLSKHRDHSEAVIVAIIDDGLFWEEISVDGTAPYDASNLAYNTSEPLDGLDNDGNGKVDDYLGWDFANADNDVIPASEANNHGTNIAYLIQSNLNTFTSICKGAKIKILPLKAGFDYSDTLSSFACVEALYYAQEMGASIINCSWGSSEYSYFLKSAIDNLEDANVLVVAASGNGGSDGLGIDTDAYGNYPSGYTNSNILSVAAINREGNLADFSNYGATTVDIAAPGEAVKTISAINERLWGVDVSGTSFAAPIVAAVASMLKSLNPELAPSEIKAILTKTAAKRPDALGGNGLWDAGEAFTDTNGNGFYDFGEPFSDVGNGLYDFGEAFTDIGNGFYDIGEPFEDEGNGIYDLGEQFFDQGNGVYDQGEQFTDELNGIWDPGEPFVDESNGVYDEGEDYFDLPNGVYDEGEYMIDLNGNGRWDPGEPFVDESNGVYDEGEAFIDQLNGVYDEGEAFTDQLNGVYDIGEAFVDEPNGVYDFGEAFIDVSNGVYDLGEVFTDLGNGVYDQGEPFVDTPDGLYNLGESYQDLNGNGIYDVAEPFEDLPKVASAGIVDSYQALYAVYNRGNVYRSNDLDNWEFEEDRLALFDYSGVHNPYAVDDWKIDLAVQPNEGLTLALFGRVNNGWESFSEEAIAPQENDPQFEEATEAEFYKLVGFN